MLTSTKSWRLWVATCGLCSVAACSTVVTSFMQRRMKVRSAIEPTWRVNAPGRTSIPTVSRRCACNVRTSASPKWPELPVTSTVTPSYPFARLPGSGLVAGIDAVEFAQQRRPYQIGRAQFRAIGISEQLFVLVDHGLLDRVGGRPQHAGAHLHGAGAFQMVHALEGGGDRAADRQRAVVAQQHVVLVAEVLLQP